MVNGTSMAHPLLDRRLCGVSSSITARFSACDRVLLNLTSDYISADRGLTLRYRIGDYGKLQCLLHPVIIINFTPIPVNYKINITI